MYPIKRLMVGLDLTEMDEHLIRNAGYLAELFELDVIYFLHVAKDLELPERIREKYPDIMAPVDESIENDIQQRIDKIYTPHDGTEVKIEILEGNAIDKILRWTDIKNVDLVLMGRKLEMQGDGKFPRKLARILHCSVIFLPETASLELNKLLVPVDFSRTSSLALNTAKLIHEKNDAQILIQNSFSVPSGYHSTGKSFDQFKEIMEKNALEDAYEFIKKNGGEKKDYEYVLSFDNEDDPGERAYEAAIDHNADIIIMASRGRTGMASLLLGSVADKMIQYDSRIPLLIVKDKSENLGFLQALLKI